MPAATRQAEATDALVYPFPDPPGAGEAREVAPGVLWLRMALPMAGLNHINVWALADGDGWTLIDTGMQTPETAQALATRTGRSAAAAPGEARDLHPHASGPHRHVRLAHARPRCAGCGPRAWNT